MPINKLNQRGKESYSEKLQKMMEEIEKNTKVEEIQFSQIERITYTQNILQGECTPYENIN